MQEVFTSFLEHGDAQVGKVVDVLELTNRRKNTLIAYLVGDNGPRAEGSLTGMLNTTGLSGSIVLGLLIPFPMDEQVSSHFGGTRNPLPKFINLATDLPAQSNECRWMSATPALTISPPGPKLPRLFNKPVRR